MSNKKFFPFLIFLVTFFKRLAQNAQTSHHFFHHIFSLIIPTVATSRKCFIKNLNLTCRVQWKIGSIDLVQVEIKCRNLKNVHFEKKCAKEENIEQFYFPCQSSTILFIKWNLFELQGSLSPFWKLKMDRINVKT